MKTSHFSLFLAVLVYLVGCQKTQPIRQESKASKSSSEADPVAMFKSLVPESPITFDIPGSERARWVLKDFSYDVKKTDSLVSPVVGEILFTYEMTGFGEYAKTVNREGKVLYSGKMRLHYSFQNGHWVKANLEVSNEYFYIGDKPAAYSGRWTDAKKDEYIKGGVKAKKVMDQFKP
jgi:hypothetical protein